MDRPYRRCVTGALLGAVLVHVPRSRRAPAGLAAGLVVVATVAGATAFRTEVLIGQFSSLPGHYVMYMTAQTSCAGYQNCGEPPGYGYWDTLTISDCDDRRCTISASGWAAPAALTRTSTGSWRATGAKAPGYAGSCEGQPVQTFESVELSGPAFENGVSTLRGVLRQEAPASACTAAEAVWEMTGTR